MPSYFGDPERDKQLCFGFSAFKDCMSNHVIINKVIVPCHEGIRDPQVIVDAFLRPFKKPKVSLREYLAQVYAPQTRMISFTDTDCKFEGDEDEEPYDDFVDHDMCSYCQGTGEYIPFAGPVVLCPTCDGAGFVEKGCGWDKAEATKRGKV